MNDMMLTALQQDSRLVWRSDNGVGHINEVKLRRARLLLASSTGVGDHLWRVYHPVFTKAHSAWPSFRG